MSIVKTEHGFVSSAVKELTDWHQKQVRDRDSAAELPLMSFAAYSMSPTVQHLEFHKDLMPLGSLTHFVVTRRFRDTKRRHSVSPVSVRYIGYNASLTEEGRIQVGGPDNIVCGYDLKYSPVFQPTSGGTIIDVRKHTTLQLGLEMDAAIQLIADGEMVPHMRFELPTFLAGFEHRRLPAAEDTCMSRRAVLMYLRPSFNEMSPECCRAPGGRIKEIIRIREENRTFIIWNEGTGMAQELPSCAVLRPFVRVGAVFENGTVVADMAPKAQYQTWEHLRRAVGDETTRFLLREVIAGFDRNYCGLVLRDVRFCPGYLMQARQIFEHVDIDENRRAPIQVINDILYGRVGMRWTENPIDVDFDSIRPNWNVKFQ